MLQFQNVPVLFTEGVDTKLDKYLKTGNDALENATVSEKGTPSKRKGFDKSSLVYQFTSSIPLGNISEIYDLMTGENAVLAITDKGAGVYDKDLDVFTPPSPSNPPAGGVLPINSRLEASIFGRGNRSQASVVMGDTVGAALFNFGLNILGTDFKSVLRAGALTPFSKLVEVDGKVFLVSHFTDFSGSPSITKIICAEVDKEDIFKTEILDYTFATPFSVIGYPIDVCTDGTFIYILAFIEGATDFKIIKLALDGTFIERDLPYITGTGFFTQVPAICANGSNVFVLYHEENAPTERLRMSILDNDLADVSLDKVVFELLDTDPDRPFTISADVFDGLVYIHFNRRNENYGSFIYEIATDTYSYSRIYQVDDPISVTGKPFKKGNFAVFPVKYNQDVALSEVLFDYSFLTVSLLNFATQIVPIVFGVEELDQVGPLPPYCNTIGVLESPASLAVYSYTEKRENLSAPLEVSEIGYGAGAYYFDGTNFEYLGIPRIPRILSHVAAAGTVPTGTYNYILVRCKENSKGEVIRSTPSQPYNVTLASASTVTFTARFPFTGDSLYFWELYRKLNSETVYRLVGREGGNNPFGSPIADNRASLAGQPTLYTTGNILENDPPPAFSSIVYHQGRIFGINPTKLSEVWFSKLKEQGVPVEFSAFNTIQLEENQGRTTERATALASLDNKLIVFKERSIFVIFGDGPDNAGGGASFSRPEMISSEVGCVDPRSICNTSKGVFFKSKKGIYLLSRGLEVVELGAPVYGFKDQKITSAVMMKDLQQVRFGTLNSDMLVYDYSYDQWSTFKNVESVAAVQVNSGYFVAQSDGFLIENNVYNDNGTFIQQRLTTGWLKVSGINGFQRAQRLKILGEYKSAHTMKVRVSYDYEGYHWDEYTLSPASGYNITTKPSLPNYQNGTNNGVFEWELHLRRQKCEAMKIEIFDEEDGVQGASFDLTGMTIRVGLKQGMSKTNDAKVR